MSVSFLCAQTHRNWVIVDCSVSVEEQPRTADLNLFFLSGEHGIKKTSFSGSPCEMTSAPVFTAFGAAEEKSERGENDGGEQRGERLRGLTSAGQTRAR